MAKIDHKPKSKQELAQEAVRVQDACNLRAVVASFVLVLDDLRDAHGLYGDDLARHCITRAWADKIASLCGIQDLGNDAALRAHAGCDAIAEGKEGA